MRPFPVRYTVRHLDPHSKHFKITPPIRLEMQLPIVERQEAAEEARPRGSITYNITGEDVLYFGIDVGLLFVGGPLGKAARTAWQLYRSID